MNLNKSVFLILSITAPVFTSYAGNSDREITTTEGSTENVSSLSGSDVSGTSHASTGNLSNAGSLVAYWPMDNDLKDASGHQHDLNISHDAGLSTLKKEGTHSMYFKGTGSYANTGMIDLGNEFTLALWVYLPSSSANIQPLFSNMQAGNGSDNGFSFYVNSYGSTDGMIRFETSDGNSKKWLYSQPGVFQFNRWNHLAITVNRNTGIARIYHNGTDVTFGGSMLPGYSSAGNINLGKYERDGYFIRGNLDDIRIYGQTLTPGEIRWLSGMFNENSGGGQDVIIIPSNHSNRVMIMAKNITSIEIVDVLGQVVMTVEEPHQDKIELDTGGIENGYYFVRISGQYDESVMKSIVKR